MKIIKPTKTKKGSPNPSTKIVQYHKIGQNDVSDSYPEFTPKLTKSNESDQTNRSINQSKQRTSLLKGEKERIWE